MVLYAFSVRREQMNAEGTSVCIPIRNFRAALKNYHQDVLLFASSREEEPGYLGIVRILDVSPDRARRSFFWVDIGAIQRFEVPVTLEQVYGDNNQPFYRFSHAFHVVPDFGLQRLFELSPKLLPDEFEFAEGEQVEFSPSVLPSRIKTSKLARSAAVRFDMLTHYEKECVFVGDGIDSLDRLRNSVQVGHLWPLRFGGRDHIQNALPMSCTTNWAWDEGLISLDDKHRVLLADGVTERTRKKFVAGKLIRLPDDPRVWPHPDNLEFHRRYIFQSSAAQRDQLLRQFGTR